MKKKKPKAYPFVMIRRDLLRDKEWRKLSSSAKVVYIYMRFYYDYKTNGSGGVKLAYSEIQDMFSTRTISKAFKELQEKKFIEKTKHGGLFGGVCEYQFIGEFKSFLKTN